MKTILILEDDENLSRGIAFTFEKDGYNAVSAGSMKCTTFSMFLQNCKK